MKIYLIESEEGRRRDISHIRESMPQRYRNAQTYRHETDRLLCLGGAILMTEKVGIRNEAELDFNVYGKPFARGYPEFNLSHSGNVCVLAAGDAALGVDIEVINDSNLSVAGSVFSPEELEWMKEAPTVRFHRLWTMKESLLKAYGSGIDDDLPSVSVMPFVYGKPLSYKGRLWYAKDMPYGNYRICLCMAAPIDELTAEIL